QVNLDPYSAPKKNCHKWRISANQLLLYWRFFMVRASPILLAALLVLFGVQQGQATNLVEATTIKFDTGQPMSPAAGKVNGSGSYTLATGWTLVDVKMYATKAAGGEGGQANCTTNACEKSWNGQIAGLPGGTYDIFARI